MATDQSGPEVALSEFVAQQRFVARQPIFDTSMKVVAYELLFRGGPANFFPPGTDTDHAARSVVADAFHTFGLDALSGGKRLYFNCTRGALLEGFFSLLPATVAVVEILETVEADDDVLAAIQALRDRGYPIALDDFVLGPRSHALAALADTVKVDFVATLGDERAEVVRRFARSGLAFLAEKVETAADFEQARAAGYSLFQGYFFARPQMIEARDVPAGNVARLRLMSELMRDTDLDRIEQTIKSDVALSVKLLRYLNSASFGWATQVDSIKRAIILLGERPFRQWATLVTITTLCADKPSELLVLTLVRARLCEQVAVSAARPHQAFELFLCGLFSTLDALFGRPLEVLLDEIDASRNVRAALERKSGDLADVYRAILAYERGDWEDADLVTLIGRLPSLAEHYREAVAWAQQLAGAQ